MRVVEIDPSRDARWDAYVSSCPAATGYHLAVWAKVLQKVYRWTPVYLAVEDEQGRLGGVLPLTYKSRVVTGRRFKSLPIVRFAGPVADTRAGELALLKTACRLTDERAELLTVNGLVGEYEQSMPGLTSVPCWPTWQLSLSSDMESMERRWRNRSKAHSRQIRKARSLGVVAAETSSMRDVDDFYRLYLRTMRRNHANSALVSRDHAPPRSPPANRSLQSVRRRET